jgi:putative hydrolase of the HAD superfamily
MMTEHSHKMTTPTLLFDLGGVIVPWVGFEALAKMTGFDREEIDDRFQMDPATRRYERGHATTAEFCEAFPRVFDLDLTPEDVPALWNSWVHPPFPDVIEAIQSLNATHRTACLSNTNALHWDHVGAMIDLPGLFDPPMASHILHAAKPDQEIYEMALVQLGNPNPADVWFFEDTQKNIDGARAAGLTVHPVDRKHGVLPVLESLGLIS